MPPALSGGATADPRPAAVTYRRDRDGVVELVIFGDTDGDPDVVTAGDRTLDPEYHADGRLDTVSFDGHTLTFGYDAVTHRLASVSTGTVSFVVDRDGPLLVSQTWSGSAVSGGTVAFDFDPYLRTNSIAAGGRTSRYAFDDDGVVECVTINGSAPDGTCSAADSAAAMAVTLDVDVSSTTLTTRIGSGASALGTETHLDDLGEWVSTASTRGSSTVLAQTVTARDGAGRITALSETIGSTTTTYAYSYDGQGRLTDVLQNGLAYEHYAYDLNGNRTAATAPGLRIPAGSIVTDARDRLRDYGATHYDYNAIGQLEARTDGSGFTTYEYDLMGALRQVELPDSTVITYTIDGTGRRVARSIDGVRDRQWLYLDALRPLVELDGVGAVRRVFVYGTGRVPDLMIIPSGPDAGTYRILTDWRGSVRRVVNVTTGAVAQSIDYDSFGRVLGITAPGFQPFGFAGGLYDEHTNLVRFGARDYDGKSGRWTTTDPIGFHAGDPNLYAYCGADPVGCIDASGMNGGAVACSLGAGALAGEIAIGILINVLLDLVFGTSVAGDSEFGSHSPALDDARSGISAMARPRNNVDQNRQAADAMREAMRRTGRRPTPRQRRAFHDELGRYAREGEDPSFDELVDIAAEILGG